MYQFNPTHNTPVATGAFGNMHWGHAVSKDLLGWEQLPIALVPDVGSCGGEWSGSATLNAPATAGGNGGPVLSYAVQCNSAFGQAVLKKNPTADPLLLEWTANNIVGHKAPKTGGFRDPSTAWKGKDGVWRQLLACNGASCLYNSTDFKTWEFVDHAAGDAQGPTWEMPDVEPLIGGSFPDSLFYKVGMENGTSYWTTGTFDETKNVFVVDAANGVKPLGDATQRCDYGDFYSSKTFVGSPLGLTLIGWIGEEVTSPMKAWAGIQSIPRLVTWDPEHKGRVVFNPIAAVESLRIEDGSQVTWSAKTIGAGTSSAIGISAKRLDIQANFTGAFKTGARFGIKVRFYVCCLHFVVFLFAHHSPSPPPLSLSYLGGTVRVPDSIRRHRDLHHCRRRFHGMGDA